MLSIFAGAENIISSLGFTAEENIANILQGNSGISIDDSGIYSPIPLPLSRVNYDRMEELLGNVLPASELQNFTLLEKMFLLSISDALNQSKLNISSADTLFIFSSTKGNIDLLKPEADKNFGKERVYLHEMADVFTKHYANPNKPVIVSNACISGVIALVYAERLIRSGKYKHVVVSGGDLISEFIVSGFQSFQSLSEQACKPFDKNRNGLSLGEGCGTIILSSDKSIFSDNPIEVLGGAGSNDANHISGPSRTGEGLFLAIMGALTTSGLSAKDIDSISAHGTATNYNDEMEAKAFSRAGLESAPLNSYKGYIGHTLGAAGVIEAAISLQSLKRNTLFRSAGYETHGVSTNINVIAENKETNIKNCLKTASGFGGSNAALILQKI